ncbi:hypothetical protein Cpir12675_006888 [Ceratocystis pirilliformis]|uniref:Uncharacterized protein n=1 Tax=Ceratocystis pirilliformis TaxID=259994 RepID=A0ABR3YCR0_9PEZI
MLNVDNEFDSYEALLSIREHETKLSAGRLRRIKYYDVNQMSDVKFEYDPNEDDDIPKISIERDAAVYNHLWKSLRQTTSGSDAIDICTEFKETEGMYITGFDIGKDSADGR